MTGPLRSFSPRQIVASRLSREARGLARDSFLLSVSSVVTMAGYFAQIMLITHLLGLEEYGTFVLAVSFVALVGGFFDVQIAATPIAFAADHIDRQPATAAGVFQFSYVVELITGVAAFVVVATLAPFVGPHLAGEEGAVIFLLYGFTLLARLGKATSSSLLRLFDRFGAILRLVVLREVLRVGVLATVLLTIGTLEGVAVSLVLVEALVGGLGLVVAARAFATKCGRSLWTPALGTAKPLWRPMLSMMFHTNLVTYAKLVQTQVPTLLLGAMRSPVDVGAFKVATAIAAAAGKPVDPAWAAALPRLSRLWTRGKRFEIRHLLTQATIAAGVGLGILGLVVLLLREPLLRLVGGDAATVASTVLVLAVLGGVVNGTFFWNTPLLYAAKQARLAARAYVLSSLILAPVLVLFINWWGAVGAATALLLFSILLNVILTATALKVLRQPLEQRAPEGDCS